MRKEPLITVSTVTALVAAVVGALVAFGVDLSDDQQKAILGLASVVAPLVVGFVARGKVSPTTPQAAPSPVEDFDAPGEQQ